MKKILIPFIVFLLASCASVPQQRSVTVTVGSTNYTEEGIQLYITIYKSNIELKEVERETNEVLSAISVYLDERDYFYSLASNSSYQGNIDFEDNIFYSSKSLTVFMDNEVDSGKLIRDLQALGAYSVDINSSFNSGYKGISIKELLDNAKDSAIKIAENLDLEVGKVLTVYEILGTYEVTFELIE